MTKTYPDSTIVDEHDNPIGQMQLPAALEQGKILRVGRVMVINSKGDILLQQRGKHVLSPLKWNDAASGHVDAGEEYLSTAIRELQEETGIQVSEDEIERIDYFFLKEGPAGHQTGRFHTVYKVVYDGEVDADNDEVEAFRWISPAALSKELDEKPETFTGGFTKLARNYLDSVDHI